MGVGLVLVSHSDKIAAGLVELAAQMAPDVKLLAAGGTDDDRIGTSLEKVMAAVAEANSGQGVVILCDLGSAIMTAESALEFLGEPEDVVIVDAPLIEGAVAAAVAAQGAAPLAGVQAAAEQALARMLQSRIDERGVGSRASARSSSYGDTSADACPEGDGADVGGAIVEEFTLKNPMGLHARPAAVLAGQLGSMDVDVEINGADGQSVMMLMTLAAGKGTVLRVQARGRDARAAMDFIGQQVQDGFGEL